MTNVVKYDNITQVGSVNWRTENDPKDTACFWFRAARKEFETFPEGARTICLAALTIAAEGGKRTLQSPCMAWTRVCSRSRCRSRADAFRVVYAVQFGEDLWVVHAFQKKSTQGIKTPQREIELIKDRLKRLKEFLR